MSGYRTVSDGLMMVFIVQILAIFTFLPVVGGIMAIAIVIVKLAGLYKAGREEEGYRMAFVLSVFLIFLAIAELVLPGLRLISAIIGMVVLYCVCITTADLLDHCDYETAQWGRTVWKICLGCTITAAVCALLAFVPLVNVLAYLTMIIAMVVSVIGAVLYVVFLYQASNSLR